MGLGRFFDANSGIFRRRARAYSGLSRVGADAGNHHRHEPDHQGQRNHPGRSHGRRQKSLAGIVLERRPGQHEAVRAGLRRSGRGVRQSAPDVRALGGLQDTRHGDGIAGGPADGGGARRPTRNRRHPAGVVGLQARGLSRPGAAAGKAASLHVDALRARRRIAARAGPQPQPADGSDQGPHHRPGVVGGYLRKKRINFRSAISHRHRPPVPCQILRRAPRQRLHRQRGVARAAGAHHRGAKHAEIRHLV